jgi:hypothetical protein
MKFHQHFSNIQMKRLIAKKFSKVSTVIPCYIPWLRFALVCILSENDIIAHVRKVPQGDGFCLQLDLYSNKTKKAKQLVSDILLGNDMTVVLDWSKEPIKTPVPPKWIILKTDRTETNLQQASSSEELFPTEGQIDAPSTSTISENLLEDMYELAANFGAIPGGNLKISRKRSFITPPKPVPFSVVLHLCRKKLSSPSARGRVNLNENSLTTLSGLRSELAQALNISRYQIALVLSKTGLYPITTINQMTHGIELLVVMVGYEGRVTPSEGESAQENLSEEEVRQRILMLSLKKAEDEQLKAASERMKAEDEQLKAASERMKAENEQIQSTLLTRKKLKDAGFSEAEVEEAMKSASSKKI